MDSDWEDSAGKALVVLQDGLQLLAAAFTEMQTERESLRAQLVELRRSNAETQAELDRHTAFADRIARIASLAERLGLAAELPPQLLGELQGGPSTAPAPPPGRTEGEARAAGSPRAGEDVSAPIAVPPPSSRSDAIPSQPVAPRDPWLVNASPSAMAREEPQGGDRDAASHHLPEPPAAARLKELLLEAEQAAAGAAFAGFGQRGAGPADFTDPPGPSFTPSQPEAPAASAVVARRGLPAPLRWGNRVLLAVAAVVLVTVLALVVTPPLLHLRIRAVDSGAMAPTIERGALLVSRRIDASRVGTGRVISFEAPDGSGQFVTRRVIAMETTPAGSALVTQGDANAAPDPWRLPAAGDTWRFVFWVPYLGYPLGGLGSAPGRVILVVVPAILLVIALVVELKGSRGEEE